MPGRLYLIHGEAEIAAAFGSAPGELSPRRNVAPGQLIPVLTADGWQQMRWGMIPVGRKNARGRPVMETIVNARSETVFAKSAYQGTRRAVVPASGWYEWTGEKRRKTAWDLSLASGAPIAFAAIWDLWTGPGGISLAQVATLTCEPNEDVAKVHDRMGVILDPADIRRWLADEEVPMTPLGPGLLRIEQAAGIDWSVA
jgi:putative SOS response-associated peptidase YedK